MRAKLGFLLTVVVPGLVLVGLAAHAISEEERLLASARQARSAVLADSLRDALREQVLAEAEAADAALRQALADQGALTPPPGVLFLDRSLELVAPAPAWSAESPDLEPPPEWQRALLIQEANAPQDALTTLAACTPEQRASAAGLDLEARLALRTRDLARSLKADEALLEVGTARQRRVAHLRRVRALSELGRREQARREVQAASAHLLESAGAGETPGSLWFATETLQQRAAAIGVSAIDSGLVALGELALSAAEARALGDPERARGLWALDARFRVASRRGRGWLVLGPPVEVGAQALRVGLPLSRAQLAERLAALDRERGGPDQESLLDTEGGAPLGDGLFVLVRPRSTHAGQELALRRGQQRLALIGVLVLLVLIGALFTWRSLRRAAELARLRGDFVASVTHELRTPLASIRANADLLALGKVPDPAEQSEFLTAIADETRRLSRLVDDVLDASRIEQGVFAVEVQPSSLKSLVEATLEALSSLASDEGYRLTNEVPAGLPPVLLDPLVFPRALENLILNAIRYSGGPKQICVRARSAGEWVEISVADRGVGIPASEQGQIFERFVRGSTAQGTTGTGLGLAIVEQIAQAQGGSLRLASAPNQGASFTIRLIVYREEDEA